MAKDKPKKPTGVNGPVKMSVGPGGAQTEFQPIEFPRTKEVKKKWGLRLTLVVN